jgi:hypothetical protein
MDEGLMKEKEVGSVLVAAVESYVEIWGAPAGGEGEDGKPGGGKEMLDKPVDYGVVVMYNAITGETSWDVSEGTTVDWTWVKEARQYGFEGMKKERMAK